MNRAIEDLYKKISERTSTKARSKLIIRILAIIVVFCVTYLLILPAFTLNRDEAAAQGGIDVPVSVGAVFEIFEESETGSHTIRYQGDDVRV